MIVAAVDSGHEKEVQSFHSEVGLLLLSQLEQALLLGREQLLAGNLYQLERITDRQVALHKAITEDLNGSRRTLIDSVVEPKIDHGVTPLKLKARSILAEARLQQSLLGRLLERLHLLSRVATDLSGGYAEVVRTCGSDKGHLQRGKP